MQYIYRIIFFIGLSFLTTGCGPKSLDDFKEEGEGITRTLIQELQHIHSREQLLASTGRLQRLFEEMTGVMIAAREFQNKHPEAESSDLTKADRELSDRLRFELNRIYRLEGGRQIIEKCQEAALNHLDACEKRLCK